MGRRRSIARVQPPTVPLDGWLRDEPIELELAHPVDGPPAGVVRLSHQRSVTLALLLTPSGPSGTVWSTGAGVGSGRDPGWSMGLNGGHLRAWFAVEQSGGIRPPRQFTFAPYSYDPGQPVCIVARHGHHGIAVSVNGHHSPVMELNRYGRLDTNVDSVFGGQRDFGDEYHLLGSYHRYAIHGEWLDTAVVDVLMARWLADVG